MVPISRKELLRLKDSAIVTLVVMRDCEDDAGELGLHCISVVSAKGMMLTGRILVGERIDRAAGMEETNEGQS